MQHSTHYLSGLEFSLLNISSGKKCGAFSILMNCGLVLCLNSRWRSSSSLVICPGTFISDCETFDGCVELWLSRLAAIVAAINNCIFLE